MNATIKPGERPRVLGEVLDPVTGPVFDVKRVYGQLLSTRCL